MAQLGQGPWAELEQQAAVELEWALGAKLAQTAAHPELEPDLERGLCSGLALALAL